MSLIDTFIGKIRAPYYAQITIDTRDGNLTLGCKAQSETGTETDFNRTYPGPHITGGAVNDLITWLKRTAQTFFGPQGG